MTTAMQACWAPHAPSGCEGEVTADHGAPVCLAHAVNLAMGTGPWTKVGAAEWLTAARAVHEAHVHAALALVFKPEPEGFGPFKWIGGSPGWNSNDSHERFDHLNKYVSKTERAKKPRKQGEKRWNPNAWYLRAGKGKRASR